MQGFELNLFGLPKFHDPEYNADGDRFDEDYVSYVKKLLEMLDSVPEGPRCKERVKYAEAVVRALNEESPKIVAQLNLLSFQQELELVCLNKLEFSLLYVSYYCLNQLQIILRIYSS